LSGGNDDITSEHMRLCKQFCLMRIVLQFLGRPT